MAIALQGVPIKKVRVMESLKIFVSFEFNKDNSLKNSFLTQAKKLTQHRIKNCSLNESYPNQVWKDKARTAIRECDAVIGLVGQDTHNAQGVIVETDMARSLNKHILQVRPKGRPYKGLIRLGEPITWRWKNINKQLNEVVTRK